MSTTISTAPRLSDLDAAYGLAKVLLDADEVGLNEAIARAGLPPELTALVSDLSEAECHALRDLAAGFCIAVPAPTNNGASANNAGVNAARANNAGVNAARANNAGVNAARANNAGVNAARANNAGVNAARANNAGVNAARANNAGVNAARANNAGVNAARANNS